MQSGLAEKVVKPTRKLRKERKNRSKKVRHCLLSTKVVLIPQVRGKAKSKAGDPAKKK